LWWLIIKTIIIITPQFIRHNSTLQRPGLLLVHCYIIVSWSSWSCAIDLPASGVKDLAVWWNGFF